MDYQIGQKWGVRRYQNPDGTLTEAGKRRYSDDHLEAKNLSKKRMQQLSNEELAIINTRRSLEAEYRKSGESYVNKVLIQSGAKLVTDAAIVGAAYLGGRYLVQKYDLNAETITRGILETAGRVGATAAKEVVKGGSTVVKTAAKTAADGVWTTGHNIRKSVASTKGARAYVRTVDNLIRTVKRK